jgi:hypothetical protein
MSGVQIIKMWYAIEKVKLLGCSDKDVQSKLNLCRADVFNEYIIYMHTLDELLAYRLSIKHNNPYCVIIKLLVLSN